jgi:thiamine-phosphate pyrophosphorylase
MGQNPPYELEEEQVESEEGMSLDEKSRPNAASEIPPSAFPLAPSSTPLFRILDAAANRAREGLRVIEDYLRFVQDDRFLTQTAKQLRHDLAEAIGQIPPADLLASRETQADVGTQLTSSREASRADFAAVLAANFGRLQESLRSLEEYGKLVDPAAAGRFKQIRYRVYTLQRAVEIARQSIDRLAAARLYVLIDGRDSLGAFERLAAGLVSAGVHVLQLRDKNLDDRRLLERARKLRELTRGTPTLFIVNDRPDLAALSQADGVHLGQEELSVKDARTILGPRPLIGVSTHDIEQARRAVLDGANYLGVGPTFPSATKDFAAFPGLEFLRQVAAEIRLPAFAIGGITAENLAQVLVTGISRVAISGAVANAEEPTKVIRELLEKL